MPDLTLRLTNIAGQTRPDDYNVLQDGESIGRIYLSHATAREQWLWFIQIDDPNKTRSGSASSFEGAKAEFKAALDALP